jgi:EmrB/QacA subfamily drug resistance transporter
MNQPSTPGSDKRLVLVVTCAASFLFPFMGSSVNVALPAIGADLDMTAVQLTWVATAFLLTSTLLLMPFGRVGDTKGRKQVLMAGAAAYAVGSALAGLAPTGAALIAARAVQGSGGAMFATTALAILSSVYGPGERGKALGINAACLYSGMSCGPAVGGIVTQWLGWRALFLMNIPLAVALLLAAHLKLPASRPSAPDAPFDWKGLGAYALFLLGVMYGISLLPEARGYFVFGVGLAGLALLIKVERDTPHPLVDIGLFRSNLQFAMSNVAALLNYSATFAAGFLLSLYLQLVVGLSPRTAGLTLVAMPIVQAFVSPLAGRLSDRMEPRVLASIGMGLTAVALLMMSRLNAETGVWHVAPALMLLGLGVGLFSSPNTNAVMTSVRPGSYGVAAATLATMRQAGMVLSMAVATLVISAKVGDIGVAAAPVADFVEAVQLTFVIFAIACLAGIIASLSRGRIHESASGNAGSG